MVLPAPQLGWFHLPARKADRSGTGRFQLEISSSRIHLFWPNPGSTLDSEVLAIVLSAAPPALLHSLFVPFQLLIKADPVSGYTADQGRAKLGPSTVRQNAKECRC